MKRASLVVVLALLVASPVMAGITASVSSPAGRAGNGGPFEIVLGGDMAGTIYSFCLETGEYINLPGAYSATLDGDVVKNGSFNAGVYPYMAGPYAVLQETTKRLYAIYLNDQYPATGTAGADFQNAIWWSQSHEGDLAGSGYEELLNGDDFGAGAVQVLNLWNADGSLAQSQTIMVPAPGAILLGSLGMGLVGWLRQRRSL